MNSFDKSKIIIKFGKDAQPYFSQCEDIFDNNNQNHIYNRSGIRKQKMFTLFVALVDQIVVGYQLIYIGGDFVKLDGSKKAYNDGAKYENDAIYFWDICTKKGFERNGIQQQLYNFVIKKYENKNFYSITDISNEPSVYLQKKMGFVPILKYKIKRKGKIIDEVIMKKCSVKV